MTVTAKENNFGAWVFLIGVVLAVVIGITTSKFFSIENIRAFSSIIYTVLVVLGVIVGFSINVSRKDSQTFLMAGTILVIVSRFGMESVRGSLIGVGVVDVVGSTFGALLALFAPATIIVALKTVFSVTKI
jgi:hypothetical protein